MVGQVIRKKLYIAATQGDATTFQQLLQEDPFLLDAVLFPYSRNLLHIATMHGQLGIVEEITRRNQRLARNLDSDKSSPLHIAAAEGKAEIASKLLAVAPEMCWRRDCYGMNPVHIAAMNGHVEILEEIIRHDPSPAREKIDRGQTALHLCVKHGQLRALQVLVNNFKELVDSADDDKQTILHLAVRYKQVEIVRYLVENSIIRRASDIPRGSPDDTSHSEITNIMAQKGTRYPRTSILRMLNLNVIHVAVSLIAGMTFQAAIYPPGGVWQDDTPTHKAGTTIMASLDPKEYEQFLTLNTGAFTFSMIVIYVLAYDSLASEIWTTVVIFSGFICSIIFFYQTYVSAALVLTPDTKYHPFVRIPGRNICLIVSAIPPFCVYVEPTLNKVVVRPCVLYVKPKLTWARDKIVAGLRMVVERVSAVIHS